MTLNRLLGLFSIDFLLQIPEQIGIKKGRKVNLQTITDFLDSGNRHGIISSAHNIVQRRLRQTAQGRQPRYGQGILQA